MDETSVFFCYAAGGPALERLEKKDLLEGIGMLAIVSSQIFVAMELRQANSIGRLEAMM
ncbi:protein of unknown function [uncultured Woeseiaceae bacterium]|uniref:Uncharacterized protein n=1 Tax=uncultured Woeseiaceae bacterium TaxID=1983305 RepID=A0A7D9D4J0_9GAMM|nr:protein of unknown function [uncultured Woeseiaceae bacterium]